LLAKIFSNRKTTNGKGEWCKVIDIDKDIMYCFVKSFADDTRATKSVKMEDAVSLQQELNKIYMDKQQ